MRLDNFHVCMGFIKQMSNADIGWLLRFSKSLISDNVKSKIRSSGGVSKGAGNTSMSDKGFRGKVDDYGWVYYDTDTNSPTIKVSISNRLLTAFLWAINTTDSVDKDWEGISFDPEDAKINILGDDKNTTVWFYEEDEGFILNFSVDWMNPANILDSSMRLVDEYNNYKMLLQEQFKRLGLINIESVEDMGW